MRNVFVCIAACLLMGLIVPVSIVQAGLESVSLKKLPKAVLDAVKKKFPDAKLIEANSETEDNKLYYGVTIKDDGKQIEVTLEVDGKIESVAREIDVKDLPKAVIKSLKSKFPKSKLKSADAVYEIENGKEKLDVYDVLITTAEKNEVEVKIALDGTVIEDEASPDTTDNWTRDIAMDKTGLASTGKNTYFRLEPGYRLVLENGDERVTITVLDETKLIDGIECRIVEERESKAKKLVVVSRKYFAINKKNNDVYYFGEDVDEYQNSKVIGHKGSWIAGERGAKFGLIMPGTPTINARYYQGTAPKIALDRAEIVDLNASISTPGGEFKNCLKVEETTPMEPKSKEHKLYAPDVGLVQDGNFVLVKYGKLKLPK